MSTTGTAERGIVYVATKDERYVAEAFLSATSVKELAPDISITLFTNLEDSIFARDDCFDKVICIDTIRKYGSAWSEGQLDRILCLPDSPYQRTLHLDTDTRVMSSDIQGIFDCLDDCDIAMVECAPDASVSRQHYGKPMFNVGFILYRKNEAVGQLLSAWGDLTRRNFDMAACDELPYVDYLAHLEDPGLRRKLLFMDQLSMVQLLSPEVNVYGLKLKILHESWNFRGASRGRSLDQPLRVSHHPALRNVIGRDIINVAMRYRKSGRTKRALEIYESLLLRAPDDNMLQKFIADCRNALK